jgi:hypothetical protein
MRDKMSTTSRSEGFGGGGDSNMSTEDLRKRMRLLRKRRRRAHEARQKVLQSTLRLMVPDAASVAGGATSRALQSRRVSTVGVTFDPATFDVYDTSVQRGMENVAQIYPHNAAQHEAVSHAARISAVEKEREAEKARLQALMVQRKSRREKAAAERRMRLKAATTSMMYPQRWHANFDDSWIVSTSDDPLSLSSKSAKALQQMRRAQQQAKHAFTSTTIMPRPDIKPLSLSLFAPGNSPAAPALPASPKHAGHSQPHTAHASPVAVAAAGGQHHGSAAVMLGLPAQTGRTGRLSGATTAKDIAAAAAGSAHTSTRPSPVPITDANAAGLNPAAVGAVVVANDDEDDGEHASESDALSSRSSLPPAPVPLSSPSWPEGPPRKSRAQREEELEALVTAATRSYALTVWLHKHGKHGLGGSGAMGVERDPLLAHRYLEAFRTLDGEGTGMIDANTIGQALRRTHGLTLPQDELHALLSKLKLAGQHSLGGSGLGSTAGSVHGAATAAAIAASLGVGAPRSPTSKHATFAARAEQLAAAAAAANMGVAHGMGNAGGRRFMSSTNAVLSPAAAARRANPAIQRQAFVSALSSASEWEALLDMWRARKATAKAQAAAAAGSPKQGRRSSQVGNTGAGGGNGNPQPLLPFLLWIPAYQRLKLIEGAMALSSGGSGTAPGTWSNAELHPPPNAPPAVHERAALARAKEAAIVTRFERLLRTAHMPSGATLEQLWQLTRAEVKREMEDLEDGRQIDSGFASPDDMASEDGGDGEHWAGEAVDPDTGMVIQSQQEAELLSPGVVATVLPQWTPANPNPMAATMTGSGSNPSSVAPSPTLKPAPHPGSPSLGASGMGMVTSRGGGGPTPASARRQPSSLGTSTSRRGQGHSSSRGSSRGGPPLPPLPSMVGGSNGGAATTPLPKLQSPFSPSKAALHMPPVLLVGAFARARARVGLTESSNGGDGAGSGGGGNKPMTRAIRLALEAAELQARAEAEQAEREAEALAHQMTERRQMEIEEDDDDKAARKSGGRRRSGLNAGSIWRDLDGFSGEEDDSEDGSSADGEVDQAYTNELLAAAEESTTSFDPRADEAPFEIKLVLTWIGPASSTLNTPIPSAPTSKRATPLLMPSGSKRNSLTGPIVPRSGSLSPLPQSQQPELIGWQRLLLPPVQSKPGDLFVTSISFRALGSDEGWTAGRQRQREASRSRRGTVKPQAGEILLPVHISPSIAPAASPAHSDGGRRRSFHLDDDVLEAAEAEDSFDATVAPLPSSSGSIQSSQRQSQQRHSIVGTTTTQGAAAATIAGPRRISLSMGNRAAAATGGPSSAARRRLQLAEGEHVLSFVVNPLTELYKGGSGSGGGAGGGRGGLGLELDGQLAASLGVRVSDDGGLAAIPQIDEEQEHVLAVFE